MGVAAKQSIDLHTDWTAEKAELIVGRAERLADDVLEDTEDGDEDDGDILPFRVAIWESPGTDEDVRVDDTLDLLEYFPVGVI